MLDGAISNDILAALRHEIPLCDITVDVRDGVVTLDGTVPSAQDRRTACRTAATTRGVLDVICRLQIEPAPAK
jgi:osmotically-inducible protein OsmY